MTYVALYNRHANTHRRRLADLVGSRPDADCARLEVDHLFDLSDHFGDEQLDEDEFEAHLRAAAPHSTDELAAEFARLLLTTLEPGWDMDDRTDEREGERSALLAHAIAHPYDRHWNTVVGRRVGPDWDTAQPFVRESYYVALYKRGGRLAIVGIDHYNRAGEKLVPLSHITKHCDPARLWPALFAMLPAIAEHMADEPDAEVWGDWTEDEAVVSQWRIPDDAPHLEMLRGWRRDAVVSVSDAIECAQMDDDCLDGWD